MDIIPWPVIESRGFYKLFSTLKKRLDLQKISHPAAGEFLYTIKTLMAKLKVCFPHLFCFVKAGVPDIFSQANDWGALSRSSSLHFYLSVSFRLLIDTMAEHRAKSLTGLLSIALATGYSEIEPDIEPLKVRIIPLVPRNCTQYI